jgi:hypothetical protein
MRKTIVGTLLAILALAPVQTASAQAMKPEMLAEFKQKTGLEPVEIAGTQGFYMGKTHRGYTLIFTAKAGNVWGRYVARLTAGEIGKEAGGFAARITGHRDSITDTVVGSSVDRLLSQYFGQPVSLAIALVHDKTSAPRLDVLSDRARILPDDKLTRRDKIGGNAGYLYFDDVEFGKKIAGNAALMTRLKKTRDEYIRLDNETVMFLFAGDELEYSSLIRNHGDYYKMLNELMDDLADIADAVSPER